MLLLLLCMAFKLNLYVHERLPAIIKLGRRDQFTMYDSNKVP
jgi:hypothetical protein